ncbi:hypothetical protein [Mastigocladopsis repens]|uniref:hypothetical protein n=1 Tax=Mastigocladopsis repens TaxID=221287 RepID=UPI0002E1F310|nr:hypothetical protein [Mastigocladopsis repens]
MLDLLVRNIKFTVTISILIISSLILIVTIINVNQESSLYNIGLSISTSGLATTLVLIIELLTESIEKRTNQRRFLKLFGCDDKTNGYGSIAIIVPAFDLSQTNSQQAGNSLKQQAQKLVWKFSTKAAIQNDVTAASYLVSAFSKLGLPVPQIKWDEEININDDDGVKTYILIGLSNNVIEFVNQSTHKFFSINQNLDQNNNLSKIIIKGGLFDNYNQLIEEIRWTDYPVSLDPQTSRPKDGRDYALFAKFRIKKKVFIVCGGGSEWGTCDIGTYISDSGWRLIYTDLKQEKNAEIIHNEAFAVVFQLSRKQQSKSISIVHKCIKKRK